MQARLATRLALLAMIVPGRVATAQAPGGSVGDPSAGRALFVGARALQAGGPPCGACHGISGEGLGVAASYGPDLSGASAAYGDDALVAMLDDLPFPSMAPVYAGRPLTAAERADVVAFLAAAGGRAPSRESAWFPIHAGLLFAAGVAALALAGRRRARSARARLLATVPRSPEVSR